MDKQLKSGWMQDASKRDHEDVVKRGKLDSWEWKNKFMLKTPCEHEKCQSKNCLSVFTAF